MGINDVSVIITELNKQHMHRILTKILPFSYNTQFQFDVFCKSYVLQETATYY